MSKRLKDHRRCPVCRELVSDPDNCANCENRNPLAYTRRSVGHGQRGRPTLDIQEGNAEEYFGGGILAQMNTWRDEQ